MQAPDQCAPQAGWYDLERAGGECGECSTGLVEKWAVGRGAGAAYGSAAALPEARLGAERGAGGGTGGHQAARSDTTTRVAGGGARAGAGRVSSRGSTSSLATSLQHPTAAPANGGTTRWCADSRNCLTTHARTRQRQCRACASYWCGARAGGDSHHPGEWDTAGQNLGWTDGG